MEPLTLKSRQAVEELVECWDDDSDLHGDDLHFRTTSIATTATDSSVQPSQHRDSISSRLSTKSDLDSNVGGDEDWHVSLPGDDERSTVDAITSAKNAGIPIPANVPSSALLGGTIKRLGGKKIKKIFEDDWSEDLALPGSIDGGLKIKKQDGACFPESLRHISAAFMNPQSTTKVPEATSLAERLQPRKPIPKVDKLEQFRDEGADDDLVATETTIKVAKNRVLRKPTTTAPSPSAAPKDVDNFDDLEFPEDGEPLKLSIQKANISANPRTPASQQDDFDDWAEGSLGTRYGGTRRDGRSNRSSSFSAMSPSTSSCLTAESEDEGLDGLVLPEGPLDFNGVLRKRQQNVSPPGHVVQDANRVEVHPIEPQEKKPTSAKDDFFSGIDIGDGDVFDSGKLTLNRNIKHKSTRTTSPTRRTAMTLTFTNKPHAAATRIPRLQGGHDRLQSNLEPVAESGASVSKYRRPRSSGSGHSAQSSITNIPTPPTPSSNHSTAPSTPSRRGLVGKQSREGLRSEPTTTNSQLLKLKRSMPAMRTPYSPAKPAPPYNRPPSRNDNGSRPPNPSRPKTPIDRSGAESSLAHGRRPPMPFLPAGSSHSQSHHVSIKTSRHGRDSSGDQIPTRSLSRLSNIVRQDSPTRGKAPEALAREAAAKRTLTRPARRRNFGDGSELEVFDDLPTSANTENKFVKAPIGRGAPKSLRSKFGQSHIPPVSERMETPLPPPTPLSPTRFGPTPRFARDTNASRIAREQRTGATNVRNDGGPLAPVTANWKAQVAARTVLNSPMAAKGKRRQPGVPQKPSLIKPMGDEANSGKSIKGMHYNPTLYRWEGNENALAPFDAPIPQHHGSPTHSSIPSPQNGLKGENPRPALITNISATQGVQMVGGMVFDPQLMCWLKVAPSSNPLSPSMEEEEEDPFAGLEDLEDRKDQKSGTGQGTTADGEGKLGGMTDEWLVGEEFDVGPEFVRRQREEEDRWRRKVDAWVTPGRKTGEGVAHPGREEWRWAIRDLCVGR
ncbi:MAG: hypothetical protein M1835_000370 [Candelina submexicana]|nr:MAG: hypothetical protein M1835_000370 [Candelina submexicana]